MKTKVGLCKLTGRSGKLIKAHIIPKALTRPSRPGNAFTQAGPNFPPRLRWDSWYDTELVIKSGEAVLEALDTWAVSTFRKHRLVWSGFDDDAPEFDSHEKISGTPFGIRTIRGIDPKLLRLFVLSLLWRAAVSERIEFSDVQLPFGDIEALRQILLTREPGLPSFYPATLTQLVTKGEIHNQSPIKDEKSLPILGGWRSEIVPMYRFYFDGLIVHIHIPKYHQRRLEEFGDGLVGNSDRLLLCTLPYEHSLQKVNLEQTKAWSEEQYKLDEES